MAVNKLNIRSLNCRGMATAEKRQDIFSKLKEEKVDICLLQDVHWNEPTLVLAKEQCEYTIICSTFNTLSRGTAILINNTFEFSTNDNIIDSSGNYTFTELKLPSGLEIVIGSIYAPNQDSPDFIKKIIEHIKSYENPNIFVGGDWNSTRNFKLDNINYVSQNNLRMTKAIDDMCHLLSLKDAWRVNYPKYKKYT